MSLRLRGLAALVLALLGGAGAAAAAPLHWSGPVAVDNGNPLLGVACPSARMCVVGGASGLFVTTDPTGGAAAYDLVVDPPGHTTNIEQGSCPTTSFCAFPGSKGLVLTSDDPAGGTAAWTSTQTHLANGYRFASISCSSRSLCVEVVAGSRRYAVTTNPGGGAGAWHVRTLSRPADSVSCVRHLCVITSQTGYVLTSTHPAAGGWRSRRVNNNTGRSAPLVFDPVSCASAHYCVTAQVFPLGVIRHSTHPTGGSAAWLRQPTVYPHEAFTSVSCTASRFCAVAANDGSVFAAAGPFSGHRGVSRTRTDDTKDQNAHISCASARLCVIVRNDGKLFTGSR